MYSIFWVRKNSLSPLLNTTEKTLKTYADKNIGHFFPNTLYLYSHPMDPPHLQVFLTKEGVLYFPIWQEVKQEICPVINDDMLGLVK